MGRKLFVVSDVHGHYTLLKKALDDAGFDPSKDNHVFVSCGDLFDRGNENGSVYDFVRNLPNKILIRGNHEDMLCDALDRGKITVTELYNGTDITIEEFLGKDAVDRQGRFDPEKHAEKIRDIKSFVEEMLDYYESGDYIFTHGWLPIEFEGRYPRIRDDWKDALPEDWQGARFLEWHQLYDVGATLAGKTIVCGHRPARLGRLFDDSREPDCSEPFYGNGIIAIDAGTVRSGRVNVLVIEEEKV